MADIWVAKCLHVGEVVSALGGAALLAGSWVVVAVADHVSEPEARLFHAVNNLPAGWWPIVWAPMQAGSFLGSLAIVGIVGARTHQLRLTLAALFGEQAAFWTAKLIKLFVARGRPSSILTDVNLHEHASGLGYVSGHTAVAFALATVLSTSVPPKWRALVVAFPNVVALGRVYAGAHMPLDLVGGAGLGLLCGALARRLARLGDVFRPAAFHPTGVVCAQ
jgi:undecaprenyl-diphosphatase